MVFIVEIGIDENITHSAKRYFDASKKLKQKIEGLNRAMEEAKQKFNKVQKNEVKVNEVIAKREKKWFEKYRWSFTRNGKLILAGSDATSNEIIVKRYMEDNDYHFHTNIVGSAHVVLKGGKSSNKDDFEDAAIISAIYSKAWSQGFGSVDVYFVEPSQVSKSAESGEYLTKGAFVIRGEKNWVRKVSLSFYVGLVNLKDFGFDDYFIMVGSKETFQKLNSKFYVNLIPGGKKKSDVCNELVKDVKLKGFKQFDVSDFLHVLPAGNFTIKR